MVSILLILIVVVNGFFGFIFFKDFIKNKNEAFKEKGNGLFLSIWSIVLYFLSTFGISDFALSTVLYRKSGLVTDKKLPGTLNTQCVIPVAIMALSYISVIKVDVLTLILCIISQMIGAYLGPRFVVKLSEKAIRRFMSIGLIIAAFFILAGKFNILPSGGNETGLRGIKLIIAMISLFVFGALNNIGIGSYAPTMAVIYALGLNPGIAFPIMMGACTFSVPLGSIEFVRLGEYSRKITFFTSIFGIIGVLIAVFIVKSLNLEMVQWIVVAVILYTAISMILEELKKPKTKQNI
ncbi:sulfite exporter TauE/SafE family protein [Oceanotoga teriensis]|jgi:uncharacterized membrane protein YfcA|uniref:Membrane transporter protein n=1 Tax=Oceanotoga teriensis TaxID=515440 RepID=A0AA45HI03_9BACT|nr:sulfite exporter TauE/SafE family protein [Oceanotoga teriensis]MDO7976583.1 sulfite exporter TauE/SafE family protein [Oceanotoga teriensis]PWJ88249.1 hypothetical protein C7380_1198 [Oceanotoga teriensis]